ncbi:PH and SEC7 domain-containing protein 3 [Triplophysa tibetana]|uniref:PH and SEC7 domain-containing protein 3 n=1 Tax=Triplophysa tibetana TaxID=1572043 RepID=A0A5A9P6B9_9TELE|nr:PH and SEC7 domain-containing protein 3 [Triplophysa tibetana]
MENIEDYEESEPYLEAKQYMDRLNQENEELLKKDTSQRDNDPTDLAEHTSSLTVFPVTVPCASLSYATVQWDIPETPAEPLSSQCHTGSGNKVDFSVGSEFDWTFSLSSTELSYVPNQEGIVDFLVETEQQPAVTLPNEIVSSQVYCCAGLTSNEKKPHILVPPKQTSQSSYPGVEGPEIEKQTEEWTEKSIAETNGKSLNAGSLQQKITFLVQIKGPGQPLEQKEKDLHFERQTSNLEPEMDKEPAKTPVTVIEMKLNETLKHSEESGDLSDQQNQQDQPANRVGPVSSEEKQFSDQMKEIEKKPTQPEKPSEPPEAEMARRTSERHPLKQTEHFMSSYEKQFSEQLMCLNEKKSSEQFMSLDEKQSSEQFMSLDEKKLSEQFMCPDGKQSSEQFLSLEEKQSSEQFMSLDKKRSSEQFMSPDEKQSSEQIMSPEEKLTYEQFISPEEKESSEQFMSLDEKQSSEQFMSLDEKQLSEQFMCPDEKQSSEQFLSLEEKQSSEQFMSLDKKRSSEQFMSPDEKQSSEQILSPEEKLSYEQFISPEEKESSEQFMSLEEKQSLEQFMSPEEKQSLEQFMSPEEKQSSEQFMSPEEKQSSEQFMSPEEKQSSEQFMSPEEKQSSEQFMSPEEKQSSEQFMSPEEKQSSEQFMSPEEKQSSEQFMSPEEKQSSEQFMNLEENQSSEQFMSPEEKQCLDNEKREPLQMKSLDPTEEPQCSGETGYLDDQKQHGVVTDEEVNHVPNDVMREGCVQETVLDTVCHHIDGSVKVLDRAEAQRLAERLYRLDGFKRTDVVRHLDKESFLKVVVLIGETQERERVLQHFSCRFQQCNPDTFSSSGAVLTLTCAIMLLNTDLHGQNVGKPMTLAEFISNLEGMNSGENFTKDSLKSLYNSIKSDPLRWAIEDDVLAKSMTLEQDLDQDGSLRSKSNPFQDLPHNKRATVFQKGFLKRKAQADVDGKRTPWGKRSWKTFYAVLKGMVLYLQKDEYQMDWQSSEEVVSVHHALAERALNYTKKPHVLRLQTADWRVFLFEATSTEQMNSWIGRINLVSALYSSPPFPAAVGSQKKFCRPILPASQSNLTLDEQLESHRAMLENFQRDLSDIQQEAPDGRKNKARESEEHRQREEYLQYEMSRYEVFVKILEAWQSIEKSQSTVEDKLNVFDEGLWRGEMNGEEEKTEGLMKRSVSSPSLELEAPAQPVVKVRRNISERRTYRKIVIPRRNKEI